MKNVVLISAVQRHSAFQDDLSRKLLGKTLVQRAIDKAQEIGIPKAQIYVCSNSELVCLTADRAGVKSFFDLNLGVKDSESLENFQVFLQRICQYADSILYLSPYAPLLKVHALHEAEELLRSDDVDVVTGVRFAHGDNIDWEPENLATRFFEYRHRKIEMHSDAFMWCKATALTKFKKNRLRISNVSLDEDTFEVRSHQDWWVCEKLLARKRIVFRVIGTPAVGMGHIYRTLSLAHEITDHELIFVTDPTNVAAIDELRKYQYRLEVIDKCTVREGIRSLRPDLVVNDILNTQIDDVAIFQRDGAAVVNFEDLGPGAREADLTFNELYDQPQYDRPNTYWGHRYFFVRDEFADATPCRFRKEVDAILLAFGGVDQHDLTRKVLSAIEEVCRRRGVHIFVVTGPGYSNFEELAREIKDKELITATHATGVISRVMEKVSLAVTSNGRTVYEMAHMNIPAIVVPQHERERTHAFACKENGFVPLTPYSDGTTESEVKVSLERLLDSVGEREQLFNRTLRFRFDQNKRRIIDLIEACLDDSDGVTEGKTQSDCSSTRTR